MLHIVLVTPEIPQNTGTIGRLCVCTDARLHLIRPLGFSLDASRVRRAGLDYWKHVDLHVYDDWDAFMRVAQPERLLLLTTKAERSLFQTELRDGDYLVFGKETSGLSDELLDAFPDHLLTIPMPGRHARSHNLANAVSVVLYEALRQTRWNNDC